MGEHPGPICGNVFVQQDKRALAKILAVMLDKVEAVEDRGSSGLLTGQFVEP
jgi:hypothetical protein